MAVPFLLVVPKEKLEREAGKGSLGGRLRGCRSHCLLFVLVVSCEKRRRRRTRGVFLLLVFFFCALWLGLLACCCGFWFGWVGG